MKRFLILLAIFLSACCLLLALTVRDLTVTAIENLRVEVSDPDVPIFKKGKVNKEEFMRRRAEYFGLLRGVDPQKPVHPKRRQEAVAQMERQEAARQARPESDEKNALLVAWTPIGPAPIPNGQVNGPTPTAVSGRVSAISVHPTNPDIAFVGTAQGGVYRTLNGGGTWEAMMDTAQTLAIGAVTIDTGNPSTVYVGTGEGAFGGDSYFGVGVYRIDNALGTVPTLHGPFNLDNQATPKDVFTGRSISEIAVYEFLPGQIYVSTTKGKGGVAGSFPDTLPDGTALGRRGIWRSDNIMSENPRFKQVGIWNGCGGVGGTLLDMSVRDIALDPTNADRMWATVIWENANAQLAPFAGVYTIYDHRAITQSAGTSCARILPTDGSNFNDDNAELAVHHSNASGPRTVYVARGIDQGQVWRSVGEFDSPWTMTVDNNFCGGQCVYDIAVGVDPVNANRVYLGGDPNMFFGISTDGGTVFNESSIGVHSDTHAIAVSKSNPSIIYLGTDGGIYRSINAGATWTPLNNTQFNATQFHSVATHPTDQNFTIGGTQDNATVFRRPNGTWIKTSSGDGGHAVIDQSASDTANVNVYHTIYFTFDTDMTAPDTTINGYYLATGAAGVESSSWTPRGCFQFNTVGNGISCTAADNVSLMYPPLEQGPGTPNTIYYGTDKLYRSADTGATHAVVSQNPIQAGVAISAIGISPQDDAARIVGLQDGGIWGTRVASTTLTNLDTSGGLPPAYISRVVFDPQNPATVYVALSRLGTTTIENVWKTTNFNNGVQPVWTAASGSGSNRLPGVPVNAFLVDPSNSNILYAGTDIGVYRSTDAGANWTPFGTGLPRIAVFDMAFAPGSILRIATHGRGMWELPVNIGSSPTVSIGDVSLAEGNSGTTAFNFNVTLSESNTQTVTVNYTTVQDTASAPSDYNAVASTLTFTPGQTSRQVTILVNGDTTVEPNEHFTVVLTSPTNATIGNGQGNGIIINDDGALSINDVSVNEGNSGTTNMTFNVSLSAPPSQTVSVNYATANGSATAGSDYTAANGTLTFNPGETSKSVTVQVTGDTTVEPNETFTVTLSGVSNSTIADGQGVGTILNDDTNISINDVSLTEGNSGTKAFTFNVTLTPAVPATVTVNYATSSGSASSPSDYTHVPVTGLTFNPNESSKPVTILVNGDTDIEPNEDFLVSLSSAVGGTIADGQGTGTILNDDTSISISDVSLSEGNTGSTLFPFNVTVSPPVPVPVSVNYATANDSATAGSDYTSASGTLTIDANQTTKQINITVSGDTFVEPDEIFNVNLSNAVGAAIGDNQGRGTILNDDTAISINDVSLSEGNAGNPSMVFTVTLSAASSQTVTVDFITDNGSALSGSDYVASNGTLTFNPAEISKTVSIIVIGDTTAEPNETFTVNLSGATNATIADAVGVGTILNDDGGQSNLSINDVSLNEGNSGTTAFTFTVNLTPASAQVVTVNYATADGTAIAPGDYAAVPPTTLLTFAAGELSKQVSVSVAADTVLEPNESFTVNLTNPSNAVIADNQGAGTIVNDDTCSYSINPTNQSFPLAGGTNGVQVTAPAGCAWTAVINPSSGPQAALRLFGLADRLDVFGTGPTQAEAAAPAAVFPGTGVGPIPDGFAGTPPQYGPVRNVTFSVSGMTAPMSAISVDVTLQHTWVGDVDMILTAPNGVATLITVSRIGVTTDVPFGSDSDYSGTYTFSDTAAGPNIWIAADTSPVPSGTYRTTAGGGPGQSDPPPVTSLMATFGSMSTAQVNGTWTLSLRDAAEQDTGSVSAANLNITGTTPASFLSITSGANGSGNGTVNYTVGANTTGASRTGTMTIAGKTFTINQSNTASTNRTRFDYDGDGKADRTVRRPSNDLWYLLRTTAGYTAMTWGVAGDLLAPADYDGDGKTDIAVFRPATGTWFVVNSGNGAFITYNWGASGDLPVPADHNADGKADLVLFRQSNGMFYRRMSDNSFSNVSFGVAGDKPVIGDFDNDGQFDIGVYRPSNNNWYIRKSTVGFFVQTWGEGSDVPVPADYDGDGQTDLAVWRSSNGRWYRALSTAGFDGVNWGVAGDKPIPADYDGDGKADVAIFRPATGTWYMIGTTIGQLVQQFGQDGDVPTPSAFIY